MILLGSTRPVSFVNPADSAVPSLCNVARFHTTLICKICLIELVLLENEFYRLST